MIYFLGWDDLDEENLAQDVPIVLASAEFSRGLTKSVIWLNDKGLDIRCIRLKPEGDRDQLHLVVQQVIPLAEAEEYQMQLRDKG